MAKFVAGSLKLISVFYCFISRHSNTIYYLLLVYLLAVLCRIYGLDLPTSSAITSMRGAKASVSPPRQSPHCVVNGSKVRTLSPSCAIVSDMCQLGHGSGSSGSSGSSERLSPKRVEGLRKMSVVGVATGTEHTAAVTSAGTVSAYTTLDTVNTWYITILLLYSTLLMDCSYSCSLSLFYLRINVKLQSSTGKVNYTGITVL